ncbi:hypothetical protein AADG42_05250 [Ammonicoccus fulvus]|uniref:Uncharacterized protein n=1 Tax=Ammonicoccus fulvus TaxID=3138240 RepID=A0ABZ3FPJ5_9ACTN
MSQNPNEAEGPQEWKTYPHGPEPTLRPGSGSSEGYADPPVEQYGAPNSYGDYEAYPPPPGTHQNQPYPYQQAPPPKPSSRLSQTWVWIIIGLVASFVIFNVVDGNAWSVFLFVGVAWWLWNRNRRG